MINKLITFSTLLVVLLAACQSVASSPTVTPEEQVQPSEVSSPTELPPLPEVSPTPTEGRAANQAEANCTVVSRQPTPGPTQQSIIPPVSETDWVVGPEDAKVTIIEYGDFQ
jgi:hypothetical protein